MKKFLIVILVLAAAAWLGSRFLGDDGRSRAPAQVDMSTLRSIEGGDVVGFKDDRNGASVWLGLPFAAPTDGTNRWKAPRAVQNWDGTREALAAGAMCPQFASLLSGAGDSGDGNQMVGQEDCLYLNVWAPPSAKARPVMLWVHGGGNTIGHGGSYDGSTLATTEDVVVITFNYRLGVFGWFNHPALHTGDPADDSGNYGTLDIVRALEWVRDNATAFGGDPNNVTLFGESAGGFDILAMIASPLAKDLFHRAIVQSGGFQVTELQHARGFASEGGHPFSSAEIASKLLVAKGRAPDAATARTIYDDLPPAQIRELLYETSAEEMFALFDSGGFGMLNLPDNLADGYVLPNLSNAEIFGVAANHNSVPTILGTNRDEPALFMVRDPQYLENFLWVFPRLKDEDSYLREVRYGALAWKERGVDSIAELMTATGNPNVYAYRFDWDEAPSVMGFDLGTALGAAHGLEIAFVFGEFEGGLGLGYLYNDSEHKDLLARSMMGYWAEFARNGNPGTGSRNSDPAWTAWGQGGQRAIVLDTPPAGIRMIDEYVTPESLIASIETDPGIDSQQERCRTYAKAFQFGGFDTNTYAQLGDGGCSAFAVETFWDS